MFYFRNLAKISLGQRDLYPRMAIYYVTTRCNFNCAYCEDFGARRNALQPEALALADARRLLKIIRTGVDALWLTGGEPLLAPHLADLLAYARREAKFRSLSLISNGSLLPLHPEILPLLDRLIVSLDSLDPAVWSALDMPIGYADNILDNIRVAARQQKKHGFQLMLNTVITPAGLWRMTRGLRPWTR